MQIVDQLAHLAGGFGLVLGIEHGIDAYQLPAVLLGAKAAKGVVAVLRGGQCGGQCGGDGGENQFETVSFRLPPLSGRGVLCLRFFPAFDAASCCFQGGGFGLLP